MAARALSAVCLVTLLAFAHPIRAFAGELRLTFQNGHVTLVARDAPLREILAEWERVGGTRIVNIEAAPQVLVTLDLANAPEARALAVLLRQAAGYFGQGRGDPVDGASQFARIVIMPGAERLTAGPPGAADGQSLATPAVSAPALPQVQQRIMPDGRVISVTEYPARPAARPAAPVAVQDEGEIAQAPPIEGPAMMAAPFRPAMAPGGGGANQGGADPAADPQPGVPAMAQQPAMPARATPTVPVTAAKPGTYIPGPKPEPVAYTPGGGAPPPPPIKPPG